MNTTDYNRVLAKNVAALHTLISRISQATAPGRCREIPTFIAIGRGRLNVLEELYKTLRTSWPKTAKESNHGPTPSSNREPYRGPRAPG
ncbi:hypothetical protein ES707_09938 [subsurface metagenome]